MEKSRVEKLFKIEKKEIIIDYETGSGSLYIPFLGDLFPKLFGQDMKEIELYKLVIQDRDYFVSKEIFEQVKEEDEVLVSYDIEGSTVQDVQVRINDEWTSIF